jgi:hypothetical protein
MSEVLVLDLVKTTHHELLPFGRFSIEFYPGAKRKLNPKVIPVVELNYDFLKGMPYTRQDELAFERYMKKFKTDILIQDGKFYTRISSEFVEIYHAKLDSYARFLFNSSVEDNLDSWKAYMGDYK